ncbi:MAG TPA: hypothetical protein VI231_19585 [Candidatus Binatia bacterium]|jgi:hypothetical protein
MMRASTTAVLIILVVSASPVFADSCYDLQNNRNFDCNAQNTPSNESKGATPTRDTSLRDQLKRALAEKPAPGANAGHKLSIEQAVERVTAALEHPEAADAQQRYDDAIAGLRAAMRSAAQAAGSAAERTALFNYERMLEKTFDEWALRTLYNAAAVETAPTATADATAAPGAETQIGNVGVSERGGVFVCDKPIDGANLSCREIQDDGRLCRSVIVTNADVVWRDSATTECFKTDLQKREAFLATQPKSDAEARPAQEPFAMDEAGTAAEVERLQREQERIGMNKAAKAAQQPKASGNQASNSAQPRNNAPLRGQASSPKPAPVSAPSTITGAKFGDVAGTAPAGNLGAAPTETTVAFAVPQPQGPAAPAVHDSTGASASVPTVRTPTVAVHTPVIRTPDVAVNTPVVRTPDVTVHAPAVRTPNPPRINTPRIDAPTVTVHTPAVPAPAVSMDAACQNLVGNYIAAAQAQDGPASQAAYEALSAAGGCGVLAQAEADAAAQAKAQAAAADPRFVTRGDTPMLDQTVAQCDVQAAACAEVVRQLRAGTSPAAVAAMYANAISIGLQLGAAAGQGVLNASHAGAVRVPSKTSSNMSSIGNRPVSSTYGQGSPLHPAPPSTPSTITFPGQ